jgi:hypothetical protein
VVIWNALEETNLRSGLCLQTGYFVPCMQKVGLKATRLLFKIDYLYFIMTATLNFLLERIDTYHVN